MLHGMHDSLVLHALWQVGDDDARRHLEECEAFNLCFRAGLSGTSDLPLALEMEAFERKFPDVGDPDPTWIAWAAWAEAVRLREATAAMEV